MVLRPNSARRVAGPNIRVRIEGSTVVVTGQQDAIEQQLTQIMGEVLGFHAIDPDEDFFDLGGDSIQAVELLTLIEQRMKLKVPLGSVKSHAVVSFVNVSMTKTAAPGTAANVPPSMMFPNS